MNPETKAGNSRAPQPMELPVELAPAPVFEADPAIHAELKELHTLGPGTVDAVVVGEATVVAAAVPPAERRVMNRKPETWTPEKSALAEKIARDHTVQAMTRQFAGRGYSHGDAGDLMQELVMRLARSPRDFESDAPGFYALIRRTLGWITVDSIRKAQVVVESESSATGTELVARELPIDFDDLSTGITPVLPDDAEQLVDNIVLEQALARISPLHREILVEIYFRGSQTPEAAKALNLPAGTAKSRLFYAQRSLREKIEELGGL
ncbi:MAG TPA: sigma-70 family RNA polymerase sigma factor [Candidatus Saccharimonadales bacterium]|nr:sigma-70 family RNA polymerase sigma factor [Candidatus Saccharimonadales bacterium]